MSASGISATSIRRFHKDTNLVPRVDPAAWWGSCGNSGQQCVSFGSFSSSTANDDDLITIYKVKNRVAVHVYQFEWTVIMEVQYILSQVHCQTGLCDRTCAVHSRAATTIQPPLTRSISNAAIATEPCAPLDRPGLASSSASNASIIHTTRNPRTC